MVNMVIIVIMKTDCVKLAQDFIHDDPLHKAFSSITGRKSIHSSESLKFYNEIGCKDKYVTAILQNGLRLPFIEQVPPYEEENNKSALENIDFFARKGFTVGKGRLCKESFEETLLY